MFQLETLKKSYFGIFNYDISGISMVAQKGSVHRLLHYFSLPISTIPITNFQIDYISFPILFFLIMLTSNLGISHVNSKFCHVYN